MSLRNRYSKVLANGMTYSDKRNGQRVLVWERTGLNIGEVMTRLDRAGLRYDRVYVSQARRAYVRVFINMQ